PGPPNCRTLRSNRIRSRPTTCCECLLDIGNNVVDILNSNRDPNETFSDPEFYSFRGRQFAVSRRCRMNDPSKQIAYTGGTCTKLQRIEKPVRSCTRVL